MSDKVKNMDKSSNDTIHSVSHSKIEEQKQLFNDIITMKHRMQNLASFVQNDFNRMLEDGSVNQKYIKEAIPDMNKTYDKVIEELNQLRYRSDKILTYYCG